MFDPNKQTRTVLATLEQCRRVLTRNANRGTAKLLSIAILDLRAQLNNVADSELKDLCDAIVDRAPRKQDHRKSQSQDHAPRSPALLRLVK